MTEAELELEVLRLVRRYGLLVLDIPDSRRLSRVVDGQVLDTGGGFPDLVIAGPGGVQVRELKSQTGQLGPRQLDWMLAFRAGIAAGVWRPEQWPGEITSQLRHISRR